ncbi:MAG TPA: hypothetical protein VIU41_00085, partial [Geobacteraceae bacterium]
MEPFAQLLSRLDGTTPAGTCTAGLDVSPAEVVSFLEFAAAEGIIVTPGRTGAAPLPAPGRTGRTPW